MYEKYQNQRMLEVLALLGPHAARHGVGLSSLYSLGVMGNLEEEVEVLRKLLVTSRGPAPGMARPVNPGAGSQPRYQHRDLMRTYTDFHPTSHFVSGVLLEAIADYLEACRGEHSSQLVRS